MEINSAIDLTQNLIQNEQLFDSTEENSKLQDLDFEEILVKESVPPTELFKSPSQELPIVGNQLPLDLVPTTEDKPLFEAVKEPIVEVTIEKEDKNDELPFVMTQLLMDIPPKPLEITYKSILANSTSVLTMAQNEPISSVPAEGAQPESTLLQLSIQPDLAPQEKNDHEKEVKLTLKGASVFDETYQAIKLSSDENEKPVEMKPILPQGLQNILAENTSPKMPEVSPVLFELKSKLESEISTEQRSLPLVNEFYDIKEPVKQTMVLPASNMQSEHFSDVFESKLLENVTLMVRRNENVAQIQIDPPELGKIDITIEQKEEKADIRFVAAVEQTKQLIEGSLDKLKLQLAQNGIELNYVDVNGGNSGNQHHQGSTTHLMKQTAFTSEHGQEAEPVSILSQTALQKNQLLDLYI